MKRYVLDTSVIVSALRARRGVSNKLLRLVATGDIKPLVTTALFLEYEAVLSRPEQRLVTGMNEDDIAGFMAAFASAAEPVDVYFQWRPMLNDPADEMVLEAAVSAQADALVTYNVRDFLPASQFGLAVITPDEALGVMQ